MSTGKNFNAKTGNPNFFKLRKPIGVGGVGHSRQKLQKWWKNLENIRSSSHKYMRKRTKNTSRKLQMRELRYNLDARFNNNYT
jgi:hypothetical protein